MKYLSTLYLVMMSILAYGQPTDYLSNTKRDTLYSEILGMNKSYQVFLPESYHYSPKSTYPVLYIIDGDYNFYYQTGIIESLSNVSEKIPELIVVGISDNGNEGYRKDCTKKTETNPTGNADTFLRYIEEELKPIIKKEYQVSSYQILVGHSLGGLFTTNVLVDKPEAFSAYIAIDPSYWWDDYQIVSRADSLFKSREELSSKFFVTLADSKQMGVHQFVGVLEKYYSTSKNWTFKYYEEENHGSVGILSLSNGLVKIFEDWELDRAEFYELKTGEKVIQHYKKLSEQYQSKLRIPPNLLANIIYYFHKNDKQEDLEIIEKGILEYFPSSKDDYYSKMGEYLMEEERRHEALNVLIKSYKHNKKAFKSTHVLSELYYADKNFPTANSWANLSIKIAKEIRVRQWQINELTSQLDKVKVAMEKE